MGTVYLCRHSGEAGFRRLYALKLVHDHLAQDEDVIDMLLDEARIASRIHHAKVVPILDLGKVEGRYYLVMDYIEGCSLAQLCRRQKNKRPPELVVPLVIDALEGLHAAHTLVDDDDKPLELVHRDVSPQNILIGVDGIARVIDFGIAKASARRSSTREGRMKGKLAYMAPEQLIEDAAVDCRSDIFAAGVLLWTVLTGKRLFQADSEGATVHNIVTKVVPPPSTVGFRPPKCFDAICLRALERNPAKRYQSAEDMAEALRITMERQGMRSPRIEIARWVQHTFRKELAARREAIREHMQVSPGRVTLTSIDDVQELPGLTGPTLDASKMSDRMLVPLYIPPGRWRIPAIVGASVAVVGSALGIWMFSQGGDEADSTPAAEVAPTSKAAPTAPPTSVASAASVGSETPSASASANTSIPRQRWRPTTKTGRDVGY